MFEVTSFDHLFPLFIFFIYTVYCINSDCKQAVGYIYKILHIEVTKGCKIYKNFVRYLSAMRRERPLSCLTCRDTGPRFLWFRPKDRHI